MAFTDSVILQAQIKADEIWMNDMRMARVYRANAGTLETILEKQTAKITPLEEEKDRDVEVSWYNPVTKTVSALTDECTPGGSEGSTEKKTYSLTKNEKTSFLVKVKTYRNNLFADTEAFAKEMLSSQKALLESINARVIAVLEANKGANAITGIDPFFSPATYNAGTGDTDIDKSGFNKTMFAYLMRVAALNYLTDPYIMSGQVIHDGLWDARKEDVNADGKDAANKYNTLDIRLDMFGIDAVNSPKYKAYLINTGALSFAHKTYYSDTPSDWEAYTRYRIPAQQFPGIYFDVVIKRACASNDWTMDVSVQIKYDVLTIPTDNANYTGILSLNRTG